MGSFSNLDRNKQPLRLDRNIPGSGCIGKYAVVKLHKMPADPGQRIAVDHALEILAAHDVLDYGEAGSRNQFFVIYLRDIYARPALLAYATDAATTGEYNYAEDIFELSKRSGKASPFAKKPD
jgi:hypothetical protein